MALVPIPTLPFSYPNSALVVVCIFKLSELTKLSFPIEILCDSKCKEAVLLAVSELENSLNNILTPDPLLANVAALLSPVVVAWLATYKGLPKLAENELVPIATFWSK